MVRGFLNKTGRISTGRISNLGRKQELTEKDAFAKLSFWGGNGFHGENQGVCGYLGRGQIGGSLENQADKHKKQNKKRGIQQAVVLGFEQCNALRKNNRVRMEPVGEQSGGGWGGDC